MNLILLYYKHTSSLKHPSVNLIINDINLTASQYRLGLNKKRKLLFRYTEVLIKASFEPHGRSLFFSLAQGCLLRLKMMRVDKVSFITCKIIVRQILSHIYFACTCIIHISFFFYISLIVILFVCACVFNYSINST